MYLDDLDDLLGEVTALLDEVLQVLEAGVPVLGRGPLELHQPRPPRGLVLSVHCRRENGDTF